MANSKKDADSKKKIHDIKTGAFHKWLHKNPGEPITDSDIEKGLRSDDPHVRKMAQFAKNAKKWKHKKIKGKPATEAINLGGVIAALECYGEAPAGSDEHNWQEW